MITIKETISKIIRGLWGEELAEGVIGIPVIKTNNMSYEGKIDYSELTYRDIDESKVQDNYLQNGDLLIEKSGGTKTHSVGYVNIFEGTDNKYVCNNFILAIRPNKKVIRPKYLFYDIQYKYNSGKFDDCYNKTTGIQNLKVDNYLAKRIKNLDLNKQQEIVLILDKINAIIDSDKKQLELLDETVKSRFIEMFGDPNLNDKSFSQLSIKDIGKCVAGATPSTKIKEYWDNGTISWLSSGEVNKQRIFETDSKITELGYNHASTKMVPAHTVVLAMAGQGKTRGTVAMAEIPLCTNQSICSIVNNNKVNPEYLLEYLKLQYNELRRVSNGGEGRGGLNLKIIGDFPIIVPPIELQNDYAEFVTQIDKSKFNIQQHLNLMQELLDKKMEEFFGGAE